MQPSRPSRHEEDTRGFEGIKNTVCAQFVESRIALFRVCMFHSLENVLPSMYYDIH